MKKTTEKILERVYNSDEPCIEDLVCLLSIKDTDELKLLYGFADNVRRQFCGDGILLRGIVEFSSYCRNSCLYCGLQKSNTSINRYRLSKCQILEAVKKISDHGLRTVVLQSGEDDDLDWDWLADIVKTIKDRFDMAITLSVGEWDKEAYKLWKDAGADRYLLKIETSDRQLYEKFHPGMSFDNRVRCLCDLKELGYQVGSGSLVGLKGQTAQILAKDILFYKKHDFDMLGIGLFIPHKQTQLRDAKIGELETTIKMLAVTRIVLKDTHLPATTATGSISEYDHRIDAIAAGGNVIMPNFTPDSYKELYEIYPNKRCVKEKNFDPVKPIVEMAEKLNRYVDFSRGDSLKSSHKND